MTERQQNVTPRTRRPAPRAQPRAAVAPRRRGFSVTRWLRRAVIAAAIMLPFVGVYMVASSGVLTLRHVEVIGATRTPADRVEQIVRATAGPRLLRADLEAIRKAVAAERAVQSVTVARVLPDTIRVRIEEREPAVVVRLSTGQLAWVDLKGHVVSDFKPEGGQVPPPLTGFDDDDQSERAAADNRDRVASYVALHDALVNEKLWDWIDEVDLQYPKDVQVGLVGSKVRVRLGGERFRERLTKALRVVDAATRGDTGALEQMGISDADAGRIVASPNVIKQIDVTPNSKMTIAFQRTGGGDAGRN